MIIAQDLRQSLRMLRKSPGFVLVAVITLAVGIGANTTIFSIAQAVFLRGTRFPDSNRLMFVSRGYPGYPQGGGNFSYAAYRDMLRQNTSFDELAAFQSFGALALTDGSEPVRVNINYVTPNYFELLGTKTALGRVFRREEDRWADGDPVIVVSHGFWEREFGSDPNIVGRTFHLNQRAFTVIGVTADSFRDAPGEIDTGEAVDAWIPLGLAFRLTGYSDLNNRNAALLWGVAHLKDGATLARAQADVAAIEERLAKMYPSTDSGFTLVVNPLKDRLVGQFYSPVWLLIGGSAFILLIGCANVANLLLARLATRQREFAVRSAMGATAHRLAGQLLVENFILLVMAGCLGTLIAWWAVAGLRTWAHAKLPSILTFQLDRSMLLGSAFASLLTLLLFGLGPALVGSRVNLRDALNQGGRQSAGPGRRRAAKLLVVSEVSLALILLVGAGLLLRSFHRMTTVDLGFDTKNLLTLRLDLNSEKYAPPDARPQFAKSLVDRFGVLPGVKSVTIWGPGMPGRATWVVEAIPEGRPVDDPKSIVMSSRHSINPGALANMGIPLLRGRDFTWQDDSRAPLVAIVSQSTARESWPGEDPIGKRFLPIGRATNLVTVIGVTADARLRQRLELSDAAIGIAPGGLGPQRDVYVPFAQRPNSALVAALRIGGDPGVIAKSVRAAILEIDSTLPAYDIALLDDRLAAQDRPSLALTAVTALYSLAALFLSALGLFGVLAHSVSRRTQELGIRMALGAPRGEVLFMVLLEGVGLTTVGILAGLAGAWMLTRLMSSLLFDVSATDPAVYLSIPVMLLVVAIAACYFPARRATKVDPLVALRSE